MDKVKQERKPMPHAPERDLAELLERARRHVMTPEERRAQRRSWAIGEMGIEHPEMTREEIDRIVDEVMEER